MVEEYRIAELELKRLQYTEHQTWVWDDALQKFEEAKRRLRQSDAASDAPTQNIDDDFEGPSGQQRLDDLAKEFLAKGLWLARLSRPDMIGPLTDLAKRKSIKFFKEKMAVQLEPFAAGNPEWYGRKASPAMQKVADDRVVPPDLCNDSGCGRELTWHSSLSSDDEDQADPPFSVGYLEDEPQTQMQCIVSCPNRTELRQVRLHTAGYVAKQETTTERVPLDANTALRMSRLSACTDRNSALKVILGTRPITNRFGQTVAGTCFEAAW